jgi:hypothetical protein
MSEDESLVAEQLVHFVANQLRQPGGVQHLAAAGLCGERVRRGQGCVFGNPTAEVDVPP